MGAAGSVPATDAEKVAKVEVALPSNFNEKTDKKEDMFAKEMYLSTPKVDALAHVLSEESGREAFMNFLRTEYASENLDFYNAVEEMKKKASASGMTAELAAQAQGLMTMYLTPGSTTEVNVSDELRQSISDAMAGKGTKKDLMAAFEEAQAETVKIMAMGAFPRFLMSETFNEYREKEAAAAQARLEAQRAAGGEAEGDVHSKMSKELDKLLIGTSWLNGLLASVENLPVCVSLAAANKELPGFPLIYVNAAFESTTGYPRTEIIGQNCRFLQKGKKPGHEAEKESIKRLSLALREGRAVKVAITNFRKDGTPFRNLLAMKPIFDSEGGYAFVLGIQFDIGTADASAKKMKIIDDLFRVLPNTVMAGATATTMGFDASTVKKN
jgi:PAS domain S-box-containing protein